MCRTGHRASTLLCLVVKKVTACCIFKAFADPGCIVLSDPALGKDLWKYLEDKVVNKNVETKAVSRMLPLGNVFALQHSIK